MVYGMQFQLEAEVAPLLFLFVFLLGCVCFGQEKSQTEAGYFQKC